MITVIAVLIVCAFFGFAVAFARVKIGGIAADITAALSGVFIFPVANLLPESGDGGSDFLLKLVGLFVLWTASYAITHKILMRRLRQRIDKRFAESSRVEN